MVDERSDERGEEFAELDAQLGMDVQAIEAEEAAAARRLSSIEAGRRKGGLAGAAMAGAMLGLRDIYEGPPKDDDVVADDSRLGSMGPPVKIMVEGEPVLLCCEGCEQAAKDDPKSTLAKLRELRAKTEVRKASR